MNNKENQINCPEWAEQMIECLRLLEVHLGHIPNKSDWQDQNIKDLANKIFKEEYQFVNDKNVQILFAKIVKKLSEQGFTCLQITHFINRRIYLESGPSYCSEEEVSEVLS